MTLPSLNAVDAELLRAAADNGGVLETHQWMPPHYRKAVARLVRSDLLTSWHPAGYGHHALTTRGREWLAAHDKEN